MPYTRLYYHLVWAVYERHPLLVPPIEEAVFRVMASLCERQHGKVMAINGMPDHVHVVTSIPPATAIAVFVKNLKGATSRMAEDKFNAPFQWQSGYGAFTISERNLKLAIEYVEHQKQHHANGTTIPRYEKFLDIPDDYLDEDGPS